MTHPPEENTSPFLSGGGAMGHLIRLFPWTTTPLGRPETWPRGLSTAVRLLLTSQHPMFIWWGPQLIQFYNDSYCRSIGPERHPAALGAPGRACWEEIWPIIGPQIAQVMAGDGPTWNENQLVPITRNGRHEEVYWTYSYSPIDEPDALNGVGGVLVLCVETTGIVLAERREQSERERLERLFMQAPSFMAVLKGGEHRFEMTNPAYLRLIGRSDVIGKTVIEALPEVADQGFVELLDEVYRSGEAFTSAGLRFCSEPVPGGCIDERHVDFVYQPIIDDHGRTIGVFVEGYDVTERIRAEAAQQEGVRQLAALNENLERRVAQRGAELERTQEALKQSQKLEAMGQLTGGIAHDFNNLLTPIIGSLDLLQRQGIGGEREQRLISGGLQSAERAKTLVHRLLAFARQQPLKRAAVDIGQLVAGMTDLISTTLGPNIQVVLDIAAHLPPAVADPNQLEMALLNLGVNARDAMPDGGGLHISAVFVPNYAGHASLEPGDYIRLSVADTGSGMNEATIARAIEPFFSTKGVGKGTGLGLSMVHGLASQLGGALVISSRLGTGTTMEMWLPTSAEPAPQAVAAPPAAAVRGFHGRALLVDDEASVRTTCADMLSELGYEVIEAASGEEAVQLLEGCPEFDLLITDHIMPGMTGVELAQTVQYWRPGIPTLLISGYAEAKGIAAGLPHLTKPFRQSQLAAKVSEVTAARGFPRAN